MRVSLHNQWFRERIRAEWLSADELVLKDESGNLKATVVRYGDSYWQAALNPKLCAEGVNFLTVVGETPENAVQGLFNCNTAFMVSALEEIGTVAEGVEYPFPEAVAEVAAVSQDILAAI